HQQQTFSGVGGSSSNNTSSSNSSNNSNNSNNDDLDDDIPDAVDDDLRLLDDDTEDEESPERIKSDSSAVPKEWTRWTAGTRLLPNVQTTFFSLADCPDPNNTLVIGWDAGEVNSGVMSAKDPKNPNKRHTLKIKRSFLWRPAVKFREDMEARKKAPQLWRRSDGTNTIAELETNLPSFTLATLDKYFGYLQSPVASTGQRTVLETLLAFYRDKW
ncbi:hypothetical protein BGZ47_004801, partial [Haplosporangium gracile]